MARVCRLKTKYDSGVLAWYTHRTIYQAWVGTDADTSDSPLLVNYYFYTLLNPADFVKVTY